MPDLIELPSEKLQQLIEATPTKKRSALQKALKAACKHLKDTKAEYAKAFEVNWAMFENAWRLANEAKKLKAKGHLCAASNTKNKTTKNGGLVQWKDLGLSQQDGQRLLVMREKHELGDLHAWFDQQYDEKSYKLIPLYRANVVAAEANSGEIEWYTPAPYIELARDVMGSIDTDPASNEIANRTVEAKVYYSREEDGLVHDWHGNIWLNPPYTAGLVSSFAAKLTEQLAAGNAKQAVLLVNNATDTQWFADVVETAGAICFKTGRIAFVNQEGEAISGAAQGQCFLYFGRKEKRFCNLFGTIGWIATRPAA